MSTQAKQTFFVMIGTIAEFIKLAPVILELRQQGAHIIPIATGQNDITKSDLYPIVFPEGVDHWITRRTIKQTPLFFALWAMECFLKAFFGFYRIFRTSRSNAAITTGNGPAITTDVDPSSAPDNRPAQSQKHKPKLLVHGDTVSTFIGGFAGWCAGGEIVHVEAGLRSFNLLRPFPEEFCRVVVSRFARWAFCPGDWACGNLLKSGRVGQLKIVNTQENTLLDGMRMALSTQLAPQVSAQLPARFFLFVCHRQENLLDKEFLEGIISRMVQKSSEIPCVTIIHKPAEVALASLGLLEKLTRNPNIIALPRQSYFDFTHLLERAEFVVTDGGSNQEECYFLGKACLVLRKESERREGLGHNALLSMKDFSVAKDWVTMHF
ncbi:UDP-N-acetylglucosamine 2-epimerase [bacterium]|nr:UDP-N-acetylglucosamine 2-epimerase [bacterium]